MVGGVGSAGVVFSQRLGRMLAAMKLLRLAGGGAMLAGLTALLAFDDGVGRVAGFAALCTGAAGMVVASLAVMAARHDCAQQAPAFST